MQTVFSIASDEDISGLLGKGWLFDWSDEELRKTNIYRLLIVGDDTIQGLISAEVVRGAVYVHLAESAPHNLPPNKKYDGVGGHLFAIAMKLSLSKAGCAHIPKCSARIQKSVVRSQNRDEGYEKIVFFVCLRNL